MCNCSFHFEEILVLFVIRNIFNVLLAPKYENAHASYPRGFQQLKQVATIVA